MKHSVKRVFSALLVMFILLISTVSALAFPEPTEDFYVADYAEVLSDTTESMIISQNDLLYAQTGAQIVVVTVRYLEDGYYADEYAVKLFNDWGVGDAEKNNGILLLLVTEEGKGWLTQGSGIEHYLTNDDVDMMLENYFWKKFDKGDFDGAVDTLFSELVEWYEDTYKFNLGDESYVDTTGSDTDYSPRVSKFIFKLIIFVLIIAIIISINNKGRVRRTRTYTPNFWVPPPRTWHHTTTHRPPNYRPPTGGSFRSGSSFNSGRSGFSSGSRGGFSGGRSGGGFSSGRSGGGFSGGSRGGGGGRSGGGGAGRR